MRKFVAIISFLAILGIIFGCASDIILEKPPSLKGTYEGRYTVTNLVTEEVREQVYIWTFRDTTFNMKLNEEDSAFLSLDCMCNYFGKYAMKSRVEFFDLGIPEAPGNVGEMVCQTCNEAYAPEGGFTLIRKSNDTLELTYKDSTMQKQMVMWPY